MKNPYRSLASKRAVVYFRNAHEWFVCYSVSLAYGSLNDTIAASRNAKPRGCFRYIKIHVCTCMTNRRECANLRGRLLFPQQIEEVGRKITRFAYYFGCMLLTSPFILIKKNEFRLQSARNAFVSALMS